MFSKHPLLKIAVTLLSFMPIVALAITVQPPKLFPTGYWGMPLIACTGNYLATGSGTGKSLPPCTDLTYLIQTIVNIIYFLISIAIFILAPVLFIVGGIMIMFAGANPGMLENGKKTLTGTFIGLLIVMCSYLIIETFLTVLGVAGKVGGF